MQAEITHPKYRTHRTCESRKKLKMRESDFVYINGVPNLVITYGSWITECKSPEVVLVITGNPGLIEYYDEFMSSLYDELGGTIPVWGISHGGHSLPQVIDSLPDVKSNPHLYSLEGQTRLKMQFIEAHLPAGTRLHLVGHSIGSQICLTLERRLAAGRVLSSYHLFPTVQRMRASPAGRRLWLVSQYLRWLILLVAALLALLPRDWRQLLVARFLARQTPPPAVDASVDLIRPQALARTIEMGHDELLRVDAMDAELVRAAASTARFYFSRSDPWVPLDYVDQMRQTVPEANVVVCNSGYPHAFVLEHDAIHGCARNVAQWVRRFSGMFGEEEMAGDEVE